MNKPYLTIVCTYKCNMNCPYCKYAGGVYGEGYGSTKKDLSSEEIMRIARIAYKKGINCFRLTGGEPLLREDLHNLIIDLQKLGSDVIIALNTNGINLKKHETFFGNLNNFELRVSVDSYFKSVGSPKNWTESIGTLVRNLSKKIPVRIDTVALKSNSEDIHSIIIYCKKNQIDLKILDLYPNSNYDLKYWFKEFYDVGELFNKLKNQGSVHKFKSDNRKGLPMKYIKLGKSKIIFKDSFKGTHFHEFCKTCPIYPCQEGVYNICLSNDGRLGISHCLFPPFNMQVANESEKFIKKAFDRLIQIFQESKHEKRLAEHLQKMNRVNKNMTDLYIIKLGGSAITEKEGNKFEAKKAVLKRIASEIKRALDEKEFKLIIVHGAGPFGHTNVVEYDINNGVYSDRQKEGLAKTIKDCNLLDSIVVEALKKAGLDAIPFDPNKIVEQDNKKIVKFKTDEIERATAKGKIPVLFGQMVPDESLNASVISGDTIIGFLAKKFGAKKVFLGTDVAGIYTADPKKDENAKRIPLIDKNNFEESITQTDEAGTVDVTGGMKGKLEKIQKMLQGTTALIFDANQKENFYKALTEKEVKGTEIRL